MIVLKSSDGETFEVEKSVALESLTIRDMIEDNCAETFEVEESVALESQIIKHEDNCANTIIPIPNVTSKILAKVIEYCKRHVEAPKSSDADNKSSGDDLKAFDADFVKVDQKTLFDLILAANYLKIKTLLDLTCQTVADMIKGKNVCEIHKILNLKYECTPEEFEKVRRENAWAFERRSWKCQYIMQCSVWVALKKVVGSSKYLASYCFKKCF